MAPVRPSAAAATARSLLGRALRQAGRQQQHGQPMRGMVMAVGGGARPRQGAFALAPFWNHRAGMGSGAIRAGQRRALASSPATASTTEEREEQQRGSDAAAVSVTSTKAAGAGAAAAAAPEGAAVPTAGGGGSGGGAAAAAGGTTQRPARRPRPVPIQLTERAVARIKELLAEKAEAGGEPPLGVRLGIRRRGCNGLSYTLNYASERPKHDEVVEAHGVTVFVDPMALMHVVGTVMDFEETELSREFTFQNPNVKGKCGCGESFNV